MDGMLSQEEINALLNGDGQDAPEAESNDNRIELPDLQKDTIGEISNISMGTAATTLSSLVNQKVNITTPVVECSKWEDLANYYENPCVFLQISYREGLDGNNVLILKEEDVKVIADLMMGGDGTNTAEELGELHLSAICEAMNQMMGSASTSLSSMLNMKIDISPPVASLIDLNDTIAEEEIASFLNQDFVNVMFRMTIGTLVDSNIMQLYPLEFVRTLCDRLEGDLSSGTMTEPTPQPAPAPAPAPQVAPQPAPAPQAVPQPAPAPQAAPQPAPYPMQGMPYPQQPMMGYGMPYPQQPMPEINVQPAAFQAFNGDLAAVTQKENIDLIMDVPLQVTVELGRTSKSIQEILEFSPGTIIELDKIAGEPIDVLVNGKLVAKGEVVVIEESFAIRVTEIIK